MLTPPLPNRRSGHGLRTYQLFFFSELLGRRICAGKYDKKNRFAHRSGLPSRRAVSGRGRPLCRA